MKSVAYSNNVFLLLSLGKPSDDPLSPDYIPSKLPHRLDPSRKMDRYQRSLRRASEVYEMSTTVQSTEEVEDMDTDVTEVKSYSDMCVGTDLTMRDIEDMEKLNTSYKEQVRSLESKVQTLTRERKQLKSDVDLKDDQIIHFYTGLHSSKVLLRTSDISHHCLESENSESSNSSPVLLSLNKTKTWPHS